MTRTPPRQPRPADPFDLMWLLGDGLMPSLPTVEALFDRIERQEVRP